MDEAAVRLRELRGDQWGDFAVAALSLSLAVAATRFAPTLALPFFVGGLVLVALGMRALWRHWDLLDRLAGERDAYRIPEVVAFAARGATLESRRCTAASIRALLAGPSRERLAAAVAVELDALASALTDDELVLDPVCAAACRRLVSDLSARQAGSQVPSDEVCSSIREIRAGFVAR